jgi:hypothetical protein
MEKKQIVQPNGYSMIDVVISLFVIGVVLMIYAAASNTVVLNRNAKHQDLALRIANSQLEDLRHTAYNSLPASGSFTHALLGSLPSSAASMTITDYNQSTKQLVVTVTWQEPGNSNTRTVTLSTLKTRGGL